MKSKPFGMDKAVNTVTMGRGIQPNLQSGVQWSRVFGYRVDVWLGSRKVRFVLPRLRNVRDLAVDLDKCVEVVLDGKYIGMANPDGTFVGAD